VGYIMSMTPSRPYLVRALYEWIIDNQCTPYVLVNALHSEVQVPQTHVSPDGQIVLNIAPSAVSNFVMNDDSLFFSARFGGIPTDIFVPCAAVMGIYAKENQQGMIFEPEPEPEDPSPTPRAKEKPAFQSRPSLKVVK
jgi:stringent starvation protein B